MIDKLSKSLFDSLSLSWIHSNVYLLHICQNVNKHSYYSLCRTMQKECTRFSNHPSTNLECNLALSRDTVMATARIPGKNNYRMIDVLHATTHLLAGYESHKDIIAHSSSSHIWARSIKLRVAKFLPVLRRTTKRLNNVFFLIGDFLGENCSMKGLEGSPTGCILDSSASRFNFQSIWIGTEWEHWNQTIHKENKTD